MSDEHFAELRLIDDYRAQTEALAKLDRWFFILAEAGIPEDEANSILADIAAKDEREVRAA